MLRSFSFLLLLVGMLGVVRLADTTVQASPPSAPANLTRYTFGTPSGDEVEMLELINRARANPNAEGQRLVAELQKDYPNGGSGTNYNDLEAQFASYPVRPPLAFNASLNAAAAAHLKEDQSLGYSQHNSLDGTPDYVRIQRFGYTTLLGENCNGEAGYPVALPPWNTHADYELNDLGHRDVLLEFDTLGSVEAGISFVSAGNWNVEDMGGDGKSPLLTGVVFADTAATGFYASGEGVTGVLVTSSASSFYALTVNGAYALPLDLVGPVYAGGQASNYDPATGQMIPAPLSPVPTVTVTFTAPDGRTSTQSVTLGHTVAANGQMYYDASSQVRFDNAKIDWVTAASVNPTSTPSPTPTPAPTPITPVASVPQVTVMGAADGTTSFTLTRTGDLSQALTVGYQIKGSAVAGTDYLLLPGKKVLKAGKATVKVRVDVLPNGRGTVKLKLVGTNAYVVGSAGQAKVRLSNML